MGNHIQDTLTDLEELARHHTRVAVGFSGGKDSLACLDLACRFFEHVYPYYFYFVPGMRCDEAKLVIAKERWNLEVLRYPDPSTFIAWKDTLFCDEIPEFTNLPDIKPHAMFLRIKEDTGASLIISGQKKSDGLFRRRLIANQKRTMPDLVRPLKDWIRWEVLSYIRSRGLPVPDKETGDNSAVSLITYEILHLYDKYPDDFALLETYFPYIRTVVHQREWFGQAV